MARGELTTPHRQTIVLSYYGGYSQQEIATRLGLPLDSVKTRMGDGIIKLRGLLAEHALVAKRVPEKRWPPQPSADL